MYLGGKNSEPSFEIISGELIAGEKLIPLYEIGDSEICATFDADNYEIEVVTGRVHRNKRFSPEDVKIVILPKKFFIATYLLIM